MITYYMNAYETEPSGETAQLTELSAQPIVDVDEVLAVRLLAFGVRTTSLWRWTGRSSRRVPQLLGAPPRAVVRSRDNRSGPPPTVEPPASPMLITVPWLFLAYPGL